MDAPSALLNVPVAHGVIAVDLAGQYEPASQSSQSDCAVFFNALE